MNYQDKSFEVDNQTGLNHEGRYANTPVRRLTANSIIGDGIENRAGEDLGKIEDLMINVNHGSIEYVIIEFGSFLGMGGKLFAVPFSKLRLDPERHVFILDKHKDDLKETPGFDKTHWPDTNDHTYYAEVDQYWQVPFNNPSSIYL